MDRRRSRWYRRPVSAALGAVLVGGMLAMAPAAASARPPGLATPGAALVTIVAPAAQATVTAATVPVVLRLHGGARASTLRLNVNGTDVTKALSAAGHHEWTATLTGDLGLQHGANELTAAVSGPHKATGTAVEFFTWDFGLHGATLPPHLAFQSRMVTATPPEPGDHFAVTVGATSYPAPAGQVWPCATGVWLLVLDRSGVNMVSSTSYPLCSSGNLSTVTNALKAITNADFVVVNSLHHDGSAAGPALKLGSAMALIGAVKAEFDAVDLNKIQFSALGIPGLPAGQASTVGGDDAGAQSGQPSPISISGIFEHDANQNFTLVHRDYATFGVSDDGVFTVQAPAPAPPAVYPVPASVHPGFAGGLHVLVLDRHTLAPVWDRLYETNGADGNAERQRLAGAMAALGEGDLVFVASVGAGPGASAPVPVSAPGAACTNDLQVVTCTYKQVGAQQTFQIPAGVQTLRIEAAGAKSGSGTGGGHSNHGEDVLGDIAVGPDAPAGLHSGDTLAIRVGGNGSDGASGLGGFNGGGTGGGGGCNSGGGGGGASDVRLDTPAHPADLASRIIVAGGAGGGGGGNCDIFGGNGGAGGAAGEPGGAGQSGGEAGGGAGTGTAGGAPGPGGTAGSAGAGGAGSDAALFDENGGGGGGGGGGLFGGGGGGSLSFGGKAGGGGGGGSSLVPPGGTSQVDPDIVAKIVISFASPGPALADILRPFGATPDIVTGLATQPRYALVGARAPNPAFHLDAPDPAEASTLINSGETGALEGVLQRGTRGQWYQVGNWNAPAVFSVGGQKQPLTHINLGLYQALSQAPTAWPVPDGTNPGDDQKALGYLSEKICACTNIRDQYDANSNTIGIWRGDADRAGGGVPYAGGQGFTQDEFNAMEDQVHTELTDVLAADGLETEMAMLLSNQQHMLQPELDAAYTAVKNATEADDNSAVFSNIALFLSTLSAFGVFVPTSAEVVGVMAAGLFDAAQASTDPNGALDDALATTVRDLEKQGIDTFVGSLEGITQEFDYIFSDWGRLQLVADGMLHDTGEWDITDPAALVQALGTTMQLSYYRRLAPIGWETRETRGLASDNAAAWCVGSESDCPYLNYPAESFDAYPIPNQANAQASPLYDMKTIARIPFPKQGTIGVPTPFPHSLLAAMTADGLYRGQMYQRWDFSRLNCSLVNPYNC